MGSRRMKGRLTWWLLFAGSCAALGGAGGAHAAPPETVGLGWCPSTKDCLQWGSASQATEYRIYRGIPSGLPNLLTSAPDSCLEMALSGTSTGPLLTATPAPGELFWFLVTAANICGEGPAGNATSAPRIVNSTGSCTASCMNNIRDGFETDRDCGGPICQPCIVGKICFSRSDCQTRVCFANHCQPATCTDGQRNDVETDVDCGGDVCFARCANGKLCCVSDDCQSAHCIGEVCQP